MKLDERYLAKADPLLRDALLDAPESKVLRAVMFLGPSEKQARIDQDLRPSQFPSRKDWREALNKQRENQLADDISSTLQSLRNLSLKPYGGKLSRSVVVEGPAERILTSLKLPGVLHAMLDRPIELQKEEWISKFSY